MKRNEFFKNISGDRMPDIEQVRANCLNQAADKILTENANFIKTNQRYSRSRKKAVLIIAAIALLIISVSAIEGVIKNLTFSGFEANQVYTLGLPHFQDSEITAAYSCEIKDRQVLKYRQEVGPYYASGQMEWVYFDSLEEAEQYLGFTPSELNYIPENGVLDKVVLHGNPQSNYYDIYNCIIYYKTYQADGSPDAKFSLSAAYVGKNATIKVNTTNDIEKIILSDGTEALLISHEITELLTVYWISWIKDGIAYETGGGGFDRNDVIKMAESVE